MEHRDVGPGGVRAVFQVDGNLVIYRANNTAVWSSNTWFGCVYGIQHKVLTFQADGNLVIYCVEAGLPAPGILYAMWSTNTWMR